MLMSATLSGVSAKATGRPRSSAKQWIFEMRLPRERPTACAHSPLCAGCRAVSLHVRAVEAEFVRNIARSCDLLEHFSLGSSAKPCGKIFPAPHLRIR